VQNIKEISSDLKKIYKTVWEIPQKQVINLAIGRGRYIDQSQSLNIHLADPNYSKLTSMHFYSWKNGLKTGMYYLRSRPAVDAIKFTLNVEELLKATDNKDQNEVLKVINKIGNDENKNEVNLSKNNTNDLKNGNSNGNIKYNNKQKEEEEEGCLNCGS